jgi:hypothetical protein
VPQNKDLLTIEYYAPEQRVIPEAFLGVRGGAEGFSKNDPIENSMQLAYTQTRERRIH